MFPVVTRPRPPGSLKLASSSLRRCFSAQQQQEQQQPQQEAPAGELAPGAAIPPPIPSTVLQHNAEIVEALRGKLILAPLTRGGNLPFRRLCADFGAEALMSEMAFARMLLKGDRKEAAMLRRAPNEQLFGFQFATNVIEEGVRAAEAAAAAGANWVDLNCGCPIYEATRRGLGAALLRKPSKLARLVEGIAHRSPIPLTVKIRLGKSASEINVEETVKLLGSTGAAAVTVHGRTMEQRYKKPADWNLISTTANAAAIPVIGNGDILTYYEARRHLEESGCLAVMVGRGALVKPWIFEEFRLGRELLPTTDERVGIYRRLACYMKEHFGDDERGKRKAFYFLPPLPEVVLGEQSRQQPLINTRWSGVAWTEVGEEEGDVPPLERLLRCQNPNGFEPMANVLWDSASDAEAVAGLQRLAEENVGQWEVELQASSRGGEREDAVAEG
ncbi:hypothetical protein N2152v2_004600 [Parachlorella kessleri]